LAGTPEHPAGTPRDSPSDADGQRGHPARPARAASVRVRHQVDSDATTPKVSELDSSHAPTFDPTPQPLNRV
jgi:hypothetical protein